MSFYKCNCHIDQDTEGHYQNPRGLPPPPSKSLSPPQTLTSITQAWLCLFFASHINTECTHQCLASFVQHYVSEIHHFVACSNSFFHFCKVFHCMNIPPFTHSFYCCRIFGLFTIFCINNAAMNIPVFFGCISIAYIPKVELLNHRHA